MFEIVLRDLEGVLKRKFGNALIVDNIKTESLLLPGENYGSTIFKVDAVVRRNKNADKEDLHMIAKLLPPTAQQREIFQSPVSFRKEIAMYELILEAYKQLELECGFKENEIFDIGANYYGSRLSMDPNVEFDDDAVILLENLKVRSYSCGIRTVGYDLDQAKLILKFLARFHAIGLAIKLKKPEEFEKLKIFMKPLDIKLDEGMVNSFKSMVEKIINDPVIGKQATRFYDFNPQAVFDDMKTKPEEPWGTIVHNDFWVNNMMLHVDENGKPDDVKFVDFQMFMYSSPLRDLIFFLFTSLSDDARKHIDELIDLYYESFVGVLGRMRCDVTMFSREKFDKCLAEAAKLELFHCLFMMQVLMLDAQAAKKDREDLSDILKYGGNELVVTRLRGIFLHYVDKGWL